MPMAEDHAQSDTQRIAQLEAELASLRSEMQDFSYTVSHDLRASLRHVLSYAQLVQEDAATLLPPETLGFVQTIADSARHMGLLMDGLMELSRLGTVPLQISPVSLQLLLPEVVAQVQDKVQASQPARRIAWQLPTASELPDVQADATLLRAALLQVLDNAAKFTAHQAEAEVRISAHTADGWLALEIQDNGAGFNPALQSKLFKPFARLHTVQQFPGIGMGLALTRKMLGRMGGQISAEALVDGGCTTRLTLPT